jgi:hypothetical protein
MWESKVIALRFVTLAVDVGECLDSRSGRFAAGKELPVPNDRDLVVPRVGMDVVTRIIPTCAGNLIPTVQLMITLLKSIFWVTIEWTGSGNMRRISRDRPE